MTQQPGAGPPAMPPAPVISVQSIGQIGQLQEFSMGEDWSIYKERLEQYFQANLVSDQRKVAVLLTLIGTQAYKVLRDLCDPSLPKEKSYEELCQLMEQQFSPRISVFRKRIEFYKFRQIQGESINDYYVKLKNAAIHCKFGNRLGEVLKDKFVSGMLPGAILDRLCEEEETKTLKDLLEVALKKESIYREVHVPLNKMESAPVKERRHRVEEDSNRNVATKKYTKKATCNHCGNPNHDFSKCKYRDYKCKVCHVKGHLAKVCKKNPNHYVEVEELVEVESLEPTSMYYTNSGSNRPHESVKVNITINNVPVEAEIDSGAGRSMLPEELYLSKFSHCKLLPPTTRLKTYNKSVIVPEGEICVDVAYKDKREKCKLIIVKNGTIPLLGRDLMEAFRLVITDEFKELNYATEDKELNLLLSEFANIFEDKLGEYKNNQFKLELEENVKPVFHKPRMVPFAFKETLSSELDKLEQEGVISKVENSAWGTPLVPVLKADGGLRICADYKVTVNKYLKNVNYPMPRIDELFTVLQGGEQFTKLDLRNAYNQLVLAPETKLLLAWSTHKGIYVPNRLPFGVKPACAIFQRVVEKVLQGAGGVINFLDDIIVTGKNKAEHISNLREVFNRLNKAGLILNLKKCQFFKNKVRYLGHIIDKAGLHKDLAKIDAILKVKKPQNKTEVRAFVGLINYYGKFVPNLATVLEPMYKLLKKENDNKIKWTGECEKSFNLIKKLIASEEGLAHFNSNFPIKLVCDASNTGIGAVLLHEYPDGTDRPVCFASRLLTKPEIGYSVIHKEALAIYWAVNKFYQYLMGRHFILCTDHKPLVALFGETTGMPKMAAGRIQRWALFLSGFDYTFKYISGENNIVADCLSRLPIQSGEVKEESCDYLNFLIEDKVPVNLCQVRKEYSKDCIFSLLYKYTRDGWPSEEQVQKELKCYFAKRTEINLDRDILLWGYRIVIPPKFREQLLYEIHGAHNGISKMKALARQYFWWPGLDCDIENFCKNCVQCMKFATNPERASLIKFPDAKYPFDRIHLDFAGPFKSKTFLIITDAYSKWIEVYEMSSTNTTATLQKLRDCFSRFGLPNLIMTDNGRQFVSEEFEIFCTNNNIEHRTSAPFHPSTNGAAENAVKTFKNCLMKYISDINVNNQEMSTHISKFLFSYRNTPHSVTQVPPSQLMFNRHIRTRLDGLSKEVSNKRVQDQVKFFHGNRNIDFVPGELVYVKDYKNVNKPHWSPAKIVEKLGYRTFVCETVDSKLKWKRHTDQIRKAGSFIDDTSSNIDVILPKPQEPEDSVSFPDKDTLIESNDTLSSDIESDSKTDESLIITKTDETIPVPELELNVNSRPKRVIKAPQRLNL